MKITTVFLLAYLINCSTLFAQILFTYGPNNVSKEEFLRAYNKNKSATVNINKEQELREYLALYSKFKIKVAAAKDLKLDTLSQLTSDLQGFRNQVEDAYITNNAAFTNLTKEALNRSLIDVHVYHFFTPIDNKTSFADSLKAAKAMQEIFNNLQSSNNDYTKITADASLKYTKVSSGDIGYITAFSLPYEYENVIYELKPGEVSKPYHSKKGIHIFKVLDQRKNMGKWKVAQILFAIAPGDDKKTAQDNANETYLKLQAGANFAEMAKEKSNDKITYLSGGELPEFTTGKYAPEFENEVFKLNSDGEISKPFYTSHGYHIVKRISVKPILNDVSDADNTSELNQKIQQDSRINIAKDVFSNSVIKQINYKKTNAVKDAELFKYADSISSNTNLFKGNKFSINNKIIYTSGKNVLKGSDWLQFIQDYKNNPEIYKHETNAELLNKFVITKSVEYYRDHLEDFNPEFKNQMTEFKDGNLLFEVMERKVWSFSANDSVGLNKYYTEHKNKYRWGPSADIIVFNCNNKKTADSALAYLQKGIKWQQIMQENINNLQADSGRYELGQIALPAGVTATDGLVTSITTNTTDGTASFIKIIKLYNANQQRSFNEAKGLVINDYQNVLEEKWVEELKKKYPIKVDEKVFQSLLK